MSRNETPDAQPLSLLGVSRSYGPVAALDGISLQVGMGEVVCLLGPSGCGKSTLLRVIGGVERADGGTMELGGRPIFGPHLFVEPEDRSIGFMFQDYALFPHLTVAQNVAFGLRGSGKAAIASRSTEVLEVAGVAHLSERYPHMLSGGEQQRVALARALAPRPAILLMDEPFSNLDQGLRDTVRAETLRLLRSLGTTTIIVTHDPQEALAAGDRLVLLRDGRVVADGPPRHLYQNPPHLYAARFLGPGNELSGRVLAGAVETPLGRFAAPTLGEGKGARAFFRPQALSICSVESGAEAQVVDRAFQGESERLSLRLIGCPDLMTVDVAPDAAPNVGSHVGLRVDPSSVRVFADDDPTKF
ncbi:ABC transporter ATP-binding protein [Tabrizicola sp. J26]|uniref:ABC transporter ATP-binding protein n=1 Tax=Alitabrizicola rongguiensis TaxID=2909234 RepID=UPI001F2DD655|nr:ABC transporter ATP-binding protein [Tabrizicola rongguiensis]MCF1709260.1 ABC transporter ATP-binding protein [Tabrizicola rongguiensis]